MLCKFVNVMRTLTYSLLFPCCNMLGICKLVFLFAFMLYYRCCHYVLFSWQRNETNIRVITICLNAIMMIDTVTRYFFNIVIITNIINIIVVAIIFFWMSINIIRISTCIIDSTKNRMLWDDIYIMLLWICLCNFIYFICLQL